MPSDFQYNRQHMPVFNNSRPIRPELPQPNPMIQRNNRANVNPIIEEANRRLHEERNRPINRENINLNAPAAAALPAAAAIADEADVNAEREPNINDEAMRRRRNLQQRRQRQDEHYLPKRFNERDQERLAMAAFSIEIYDPHTTQERRLELLRRMEEKYANIRRATDRAEERAAEDPPSPKRVKRNLIAIFVCNILNVLADEPTLDWMEYKNFGIITGAPERLIHSSIVAGNGELIMFGGLRKETIINSTSMQVSNAIHFLTFPRNVI